MPEMTQRSTGNRRSVRNALFREMLMRPRKLQESDLYRFTITNTTPPPVRTQFGAMAPGEIITFGARYDLAENICHMEPVPPPPPPHPLLRWWRRLLWGE